jgi:uncharacterized membrane protein
MEELLFGLLAFGMFLGTIFGWVSLFKVRALKQQVQLLEQRVNLHSQARASESSVAPEAAAETQTTAIVELKSAEEPPQPPSEPVTESEPSQTTTEKSQPEPSWPTSTEPDRLSVFIQQLQQHWMVWLGGLSVALAGLFLVKYGMEQGMLGPQARITLAIITGVALHGAAEWFRRKGQFASNALAALAGAGSITLYGAIVAGVHLYDFFPPLWAFALLAVVSFVTIALAMLQGPMLAIMGILGAFAVPLLVSGSRPSLSEVLVYSLVISATSFYLQRWVARTWLWWGTVVGAAFWFLMSLLNDAPEYTWHGIYLTAFAYLALVLPTANYLLRSTEPPAGRMTALGFPVPTQWSLLLTLVLVVLGQGLSFAVDARWSAVFFLWLPLHVLLFLTARHHPSLKLLPWLGFVVQGIALLLSLASLDVWASSRFVLNPELIWPVAGWMAVIAILYNALALWNSMIEDRRGLNSALAWLAPVLQIALAYLVFESLSGQWQWSLGVLLVGVAYLGLAGRWLVLEKMPISSVWLVVAGHFAYSLAAVILLEQATLTLALAFQVPSLVWLNQKFQLARMDLLVKAVLAVVIARLTLNPWLATYPTGTHWSLWTYGGSFAVVALGAWLCVSDHKLKTWLEGAALHLLVLFVATELRFWLYDGDVFQQSYSFLEGAINTNVWAALALVYHLRSASSEWRRPLYRLASYGLWALALVNYAWLVVVENPLWNWMPLTDRPIWNVLLLAYGLPVVCWYAGYRYFQDDTPWFNKSLAWLCAVSGWLFVSLEIRHLWQGGLNWNDVMSNGELYTYSIVWLLMALSGLIWGVVRDAQTVYRGGVGLILLVIAKIFLIDLEGLEGLLRVLSFMGLGLSLLAVAYLHQWLDRRRMVAE